MERLLIALGIKEKYFRYKGKVSTFELNEVPGKKLYP